jgi:hypothetical protein
VSTPPKRRVQLTLNLHADSIDAAAHELLIIATDLGIDGPPGSRCSGSVDAGYDLTVTEDESVTAESYREALTAYVAEKRASA